MTEIMVKVAERIKKRIWVCVGFIFICSLIGAILPFGKEHKSFTAEADIELGSYENASFNQVGNVIQMITNKAFYNQYIEDNWFETKNTSLLVTAGANSVVHLSYTNSSKDESLADLTKIVTAFLTADKEHFSEKESIIQENINALGQIKASSDTAVDKQRFLYELQNTKLSIMPASIVKDVTLLEEGRTLSAKDRGVLGALLGITFSFIWVIVPIRKTSNSVREVSR
ncbi:MAG: hypothetical protein ABF649_05305 [Bacillus sp. (in: firmicutes)]